MGVAHVGVATLTQNDHCFGGVLTTPTQNRPPMATDTWLWTGPIVRELEQCDFKGNDSVREWQHFRRKVTIIVESGANPSNK